MNSYYMQIHRSNLSDYISKGIILPSKYIKDRTENDIQDTNKNKIILSDGYFKTLDNQVLLEIILTDNEKKYLQRISLTASVDDVIYLCKIPLPLSRIKMIYVESKEIIQHYQSTFYIGDIGYLPIDRVKVRTKKFEKNLKKYSYNLQDNSSYKWSKNNTNLLFLKNYRLFDINNKLIKYNKIMGLFSFVKNTNFYFSDKKASISSFSNHYFHFFNLINKGIQIQENENEKKINFFKSLLQLEESNNPNIKTLIHQLYLDDLIDDEFIKKIGSNSKKSELLYKLFDEMEKIEALKQLNHTEFFSAFLYINRFDGDMESLKSKIRDIDDIGKAEILLAMFGLYYGYSKIRAREKIEIEDAVFQKLLIEKREKNIKFMLNSKLDYITIESIYQYVFNNKTDSTDFDYLEYPKNIEKNPFSKSKKLEPFYSIKEDKYFDVINFKVQKNSWQNIVYGKLKKYGEYITLKTPNLFGYMFEKKIKIYDMCTKGGVIEKISYYKNDIEEIILNLSEQKEKNKILEIFEKDNK